MMSEEMALAFYGRLATKNPHITVNEAVPDIARLITEVVALERARAAQTASHVFLNDPYALHPDIAFDDLNESAQTAAHSIAQTISTLIRYGVTKASELPD